MEEARRAEHEEEEEDTDPEMPALVLAPVVLMATLPDPRERSAAELVAMSKFQRRAYHEARMEVVAKRHGRPMTTRAARRASQEAQRRAKAGQTGGARSLLAEAETLAEITEAAASALFIDDYDGSEESDDMEDSDLADVGPVFTDAGGDLFECVRRRVAGARGDARVLSRQDLEAEVTAQCGQELPPHRLLAALLDALAREGCARLNFAGPRPQPSIAAAQMQPVVAQWTHALEELWAEGGGAAAAAAATSAAHAAAAHLAAGAAEGTERLGAECAEVGFLMALREAIDCVEDADLRTACSRIEQPSRVMQGFIKFLEEESDSSEGADDEATKEGT